MSNIDTDTLITQLTAQHHPVKRAMKPSTAFIGWLFLMALYVGGAILFISPRPDLSEALSRADFIAEILLSLMTMLGAAYAASRQAYPDLATDRSLRGIALLPAIGFLILIFYQTWEAMALDLFSTKDSMECAVSFCALTFLPAILLFVILARGFFIDPRLASFYAALAATMTGYFSLRLVEASDNISHLFIWHLLPFMAMVGLLTLLGRWFFGKRS